VKVKEDKQIAMRLQTRQKTPIQKRRERQQNTFKQMLKFRRMWLNSSKKKGCEKQKIERDSCDLMFPKNPYLFTSPWQATMGRSSGQTLTPS
jgi:hypothetical protein